MIDIGATHLFISLECVSKLQIEVSFMVGSMIIDTLINGSLTIFLVCFNCSLTIYCNNFGVDLISLPLSQLDVILGIYWIEFDSVSINYFNKIVLFPEPKESADSRFLSSRQVEMSFREDD